MRGLARALGRDVKRVHEDVAVLRDWSLVQRTESGLFEVPHELIHADFEIKAAA